MPKVNQIPNVLRISSAGCPVQTSTVKAWNNSTGVEMLSTIYIFWKLVIHFPSFSFMYNVFELLLPILVYQWLSQCNDFHEHKQSNGNLRMTTSGVFGVALILVSLGKRV